MDIMEHIEAEMIRRAVIDKLNSTVTFTLESGEKTVFHCNLLNTQDIPKRLQSIDPIFYQKLSDEIFDELHPY